MTTNTQGAAIGRYKIGYYSDDWGIRTSTPSALLDEAGTLVKYADHIAAMQETEATHLRELAAYRLTVENLGREIAAQQPAPSPAPAEWLEQAFREGWAACRDSEFVGEEAEEWSFGSSQANGRMIDIQQAAPTAQADTQPAITPETGNPASAQSGLTDAYAGAREDLSIWKRRALEAERDLRSEKQTTSRLVGELNAANGPAYMGEPAASPAPAAAAGLSETPKDWRDQFTNAVYADLAAADNQDVPLEEYPARILKVLDSIVGPRHPTVIHWRNDAIQACIAIAYKYCRDPESFQYLKQDLQALIFAARAPADSVLEDAARYRLVRRGQHWSVIDGIGNELRAEDLDAAIDAARAAQKEGEKP